MSEATGCVKMQECEAHVYRKLDRYESRGSKGGSENGGGGGSRARGGAEYCRHVRAASISVLDIIFMLRDPLGGMRYACTFRGFDCRHVRAAEISVYAMKWRRTKFSTSCVCE